MHRHGNPYPLERIVSGLSAVGRLIFSEKSHSTIESRREFGSAALWTLLAVSGLSVLVSAGAAYARGGSRGGPKIVGKNGTTLYEAEGHYTKVLSEAGLENAVEMAAWADRWIDRWLFHMASVEQKYEKKYEEMKEADFRKKERGEKSSDYGKAKKQWEADLERLNIKILDEDTREEVDKALKSGAEHAISKPNQITIELYKGVRKAMEAAGNTYKGAFSGSATLESRTTFSSHYGDSDMMKSFRFSILAHEITHVLTDMLCNSKLQKRIAKLGQYHWLVEDMPLFYGAIAEGYSPKVDEIVKRTPLGEDEFLPADIGFANPVQTSYLLNKQGRLPPLKDFFRVTAYEESEIGDNSWYGPALMLFLRDGNDGQYEPAFYRLATALSGNIKGMSDVGAEEFAQIVGKELPEIEKEFHSWLESTFNKYKNKWKPYVDQFKVDMEEAKKL